jgi:hypothetical protein
MKTINYRGKEIKIIQDDSAESPQSWGDNSLFIIANHREFYVPAPGNKTINSDPEVEVSPYLKSHWIFPLEAYIHSGVVLAFGREGNFPDRRFDVSQVGWVFASKKEWRLSASARKSAACLINTWNQYLSGDVWGYEVGDDSCYGFYGFDYCVTEAKSIVDHQITEERKARMEKLRAFILNKVPLAIRQAELA